MPGILYNQFVINSPSCMGCGEERGKCSCGPTRNTPEATDEATLSKQAALASIHADHPKARRLALKALDHARQGNTDKAAALHEKVADIHDSEAASAKLPSRSVGDHDAAREVSLAHSKAASAHRRAAAYHIVTQRPDEPNEEIEATLNGNRFDFDFDPTDYLPLPPSLTDLIANERREGTDAQNGSLPGLSLSPDEQDEVEDEQQRRLGLPLPNTLEKVVRARRVEQAEKAPSRPLALTPRSSQGSAGLSTNSDGDAWELPRHPML